MKKNFYPLMINFFLFCNLLVSGSILFYRYYFQIHSLELTDSFITLKDGSVIKLDHNFNIIEKKFVNGNVVKYDEKGNIKYFILENEKIEFYTDTKTKSKRIYSNGVIEIFDKKTGQLYQKIFPQNHKIIEYDPLNTKKIKSIHHMAQS
ncbi:MAG: hypothetical protein Q8888_01590 [Vigna little leaf phytoplasma]|nr:hypothetical protein [Vigna little leaf phytoplasma]